VPVRGRDLDRIFSVQHERVVANDNTVRLAGRVWQLERTRWRGTLAGCRVRICEHLDGRVTIVYGPHVVGRYTAEGQWLGAAKNPRAPGCLSSLVGGKEKAKPDRSCAIKSGHLHVLTTGPFSDT